MATLLTEQNSGSEVRVQAGDTLEVTLPENATTGYHWEADAFDPNMLRLEASAPDYPSAPPGSGGSAHFRVKVLAAGHATLKFKYWRSWEGDAGVIKRFSVKVNAS